MAIAPSLPHLTSPEVSSEICGPVQIDQLRKVPLFDGLTAEAAEKICGLLTLREYKAPTRLFETGDTGDAMYLIESGNVHITVTDADGHEVTLSELHAGDFFGEMALIDGHARSAGASVAEGTRLAVLTRADFLSVIANDSQIMLSMLAAMAHRLRRTDALLRHRVSRNANVEEAARTTLADRAADAIANFGGSWKFIVGSVVFLGGWMVINQILAKGFDPYPFVFLLFILNVLQAFQAPIIMMSQNRQTEKDRLRADLDYEVNLKNEMLLTEIRSFLADQERRRREEPGSFARD